MTDPTAFPRASDQGVALTALKLVLFLGFAFALTVLGFVFLPLLALGLAAWLAWRLIGGGLTALRVLALPVLALVGFAMLVPVLAIVVLPVAGLALAAHLLWRGAPPAFPDSRKRGEFDGFFEGREARIRYDIDGKATPA